MLWGIIDPEAIHLGPLTIHWYGIILGLGALTGLYLAIREGRRYNIAPEFFMDLLLIGVPSAIVAARLYYVAFQWDNYKDNWLGIFKIWEGGIAIYGALIGAIIAAVLYVRAKGYSFWRIADICAPSLLAGQMIGRWGNYVNQEAYGGPVSESFLRDSLHLPSFIVDMMYIKGEYHHPTFLYESLWSLIGLLLIMFVLRRRPFVRAGEVFLSYFIWYSTGRFFIEALRTDSLVFQGPAWLESFLGALWLPMDALFEPGAMEGGNIRISQLLALLIVIGAIVLIVVRRRMGYATERYLDPIRNKHGELPLSAETAADAAATPGEEAESDSKRSDN